MKKTQLLDIIRNITRRKVSFLAIVTIMVIGVGGILGLHFLVTSIDDCVTDYYRKHNFRDFEVISNMGMSDEDVAKITSVQGVSDAEGVYKTDALLVHNGTVRSVDALSETERVSVPYLVSGEMPAGSNECAISYPVMTDMGIEVGETVNVLVAKPELDGLLKERSMRVTGAVYHPDYVAVQNSDFVLFSPDAFDNSVMNDGYTGVFVTISSSDYKSVFSDDYFKLVSNVRKNIRELLDELAVQKDADVRERAENEYTEAEDKVNKDLSEAFDKLNDAQVEYDKGIESGIETLKDSEEELKKGNKKLSSELASARNRLKNGEDELNSKLASGLEQINEGEDEADRSLDSALNELKKGELEYSEGLNELANGWKKYYDGVKQLEVAEAKLTAAKEQLDSGKEVYNRLLREMDSAINETDDAFDPTYDRLDDMIRRVDEAIAAVDEFLGFIDLPVSEHESWLEFKRLYGGVKESRSGLRNSSGLDKLDAAATYMSQLRSVYDHYAVGPYAIYEWLVSHGFTDAVDPSMISSFLTMFENRVTTIRSELADAQNTIESGQREYDEAKKKYDDSVTSADLGSAREKLENGERDLEEARRKLDAGWADYTRGKEEASEKLKQARNEYEKGRLEGTDKLFSGWREYDQGRTDAENQVSDGSGELIDGWKSYYEKKDEGSSKIRSGWEEYHENEARAQSELADIRKKIDDIPVCNYVIQTRELNKGYAELKPFHDAITSMVIYFSPMFAIIGSVVCFSTMVIVIDEQKKQVGSVKAFGFYNREIRIKYTVFGMAATVLGCALGIGVARGIEYMVQDLIRNNYAFGQIPNIVVWPASFIFVAVTMIVAGLVVHIAVSRLIKCSAHGLLSGNEPKKRTMSRGGGSSRGTLYSRLIVNNVLMDIERVLISLAVIAGSTVLVGTGLSMYVAVIDSYEIQYAMNEYDFRISISGPDIEELRTKTENILKDSGVDYLPASFEYHIYNTGSGDGAVPVLCTDPDPLENFISLKDYDGKVIVPRSRGMVVRQKFMENEGLDKGSSFVLCDNSLVPHDAYIADDYVNPINQMAVMSREAYKAQFGEENVINCFYVRCNGVPQQVIRDRVAELSEYISMEDSDSFKEKAKVAKELCAMLAIIMVVLSLLMSFMILVNLTNILVEHRMSELLVMRVNGFSLKQVIGYLLRESTFVTFLGIGLGIVVGIPFATSMVHRFEVRDFMYERKPYAWVWAAAAIMNLLFAAVIDFIAFRKVGRHSLTDITAD